MAFRMPRCRMIGGQRAVEFHGDKVQEASRDNLSEVPLCRCPAGPRPQYSRSGLESDWIPGRPVQRLRPQVSRPALRVSEGKMGEVPAVLSHGSVDLGPEVLPYLDVGFGQARFRCESLALRSLSLQFCQFSPQAAEVCAAGSPARRRIVCEGVPKRGLPAERLSLRHAGKNKWFQVTFRFSLLSSLHAWPEHGIQDRRPSTPDSARRVFLPLHFITRRSGARPILNEAGTWKQPFTRPQRPRHYWHCRGGVNTPDLLPVFHIAPRLKFVRPEPPRLPFSITACLINNPMPVISTSGQRIRRLIQPSLPSGKFPRDQRTRPSLPTVGLPSSPPDLPSLPLSRPM